MPPILHCFRDIVFYRSKIVIYSYMYMYVPFSAVNGGVPTGTISVRFYLEVSGWTSYQTA